METPEWATRSYANESVRAVLKRLANEQSTIEQEIRAATSEYNSLYLEQQRIHERLKHERSN